MTKVANNFAALLIPFGNKNLLVFFSFFFLFSLWGYAQKIPCTVSCYQDSLVYYGNKLMFSSNDYHKNEANEKIKQLLKEMLVQEESFTFSFDSLKTISVLTPPDKSFRLYNWNMAYADGTFSYYGIIQWYSKREKKIKLIELIDKSDVMEYPMYKACTPDNWYGAHYYAMIQKKYAGEKTYTLLGWDGNNLMTQRKLIDVLTISDNGQVTFGKTMFKLCKQEKKAKQQPRRILFEYNKQVVMTLRYDKQPIGDKKKPKPVLIYNRLLPLNNGMEGIYSYYYPTPNLIDGFIFQLGKWQCVQDIDARNAKEKREKPKRTNEEGLYKKQ